MSSESELDNEGHSSASKDEYDLENNSHVEHNSLAIDIVTVHGLHTGSANFEKEIDRLPSSSIGQWIKHEFDHAAVFSQKGFQEEALKLLRNIAESRKASCKEGKNLIAFISHDIGGSIVKLALYYACMQAQFYDVVSSTSIMVFFGCPHRSLSSKDMEDKIARLVFDEPHVTPQNVVAAIQTLTFNVLNSNNLFIETKVLLQADLINVYSQYESPLAQVFDKGTSTMDLSFEKRLGSLNRHSGLTDIDKLGIHDHLEKIEALHYEHDQQSYRRTLQALLVSHASPIRPLGLHNMGDHQLDWLVSHDSYIKWRSSSSSEVLILSGKTSIVADHVFRHILKNKTPTDMATKFSFNHHDVHFRTLSAFLNTTMAEWALQNPHAFASDAGQFRYLRNEYYGAYNELDAMYHMLSARFFPTPGTVFMVLEHDNVCPEMSTIFWHYVQHYMEDTERPWKFLLLRGSEENMGLWLSRWPTVQIPENYNTSMARSLVERAIGQNIAKFSAETAASRHDWSDCLSMADGDAQRAMLIFKIMKIDSTRVSEIEQSEIERQIDESLKANIDDCLSKVPSDQESYLSDLLCCILFAERPFNKVEFQELAEILGLPKNGVEGAVTQPEEVFTQLDRMLPGVFDFSLGEARLQLPEIRDYLLHTRDMRYKIEENQAHKIIARACLKYLRSPNFGHTSEAMLARRGTPPNRHFSSPRSTFADYAVRYWHVHVHSALEHASLTDEEVLDFFRDGSALRNWEKAKQAITNGFSDVYEFGTPPLALIASVGLRHTLKMWNELYPGICDAIRIALIQAVKVGRLDIVKDLVVEAELNEMSVVEPVLLAGSHLLHEGVMYFLLSIVCESCPQFDWNPRLICRASLLGHSRVVNLMIQKGAPVDVNERVSSGPLHLAARNNHMDVANLLLKKDRHLVDKRDEHGSTALFYAAAHGHSHMVDILINAQADKDLSSIYRPITMASFGSHAAVRALLKAGAEPVFNVEEQDFLPLSTAVFFGYSKCVQLLLEDERVDVDCMDPIGTALFTATSRGHFKVCQILLAHGANPNHESNKHPVLVTAAENGRIDIARLLLEAPNPPSMESRIEALHNVAQTGSNLEMIQLLLHNAADPNGLTQARPVIHAAASGKNIGILHMLIKSGANVDATDDQGRTALHVAYSDASMIKALLQAGANINLSTTTDRTTPLHFAVDHRNEEAVKAILEARPDLELRTSSSFTLPGFTALALAVWRDDAAITKLLLEAGADPNVKTAREGTVPLQLSIDLDVVRILLEFEPDLQVKDSFGNTPLNNLIRWPYVTPNVIKMLLRQGSNIEDPDNQGLTPIFNALSKPNLEIVRLILDRGANLHHVSKSRGMPLHDAAFRGSFEMFQYILDQSGFVEEACPVVGNVVSAACRRDFGEEESTLQILQHIYDKAGREQMNVDQQCGEYGSALSAACFCGTESTVDWLLKKGTNVHTKDIADRCPIHFAAYRNLSIFRRVCQGGADTSARDKMGRTILHVAVQSGSYELLRSVLDTHKDFLNAHDKDNWTPLHYAVRASSNWKHTPSSSQDKIVELLIEEGADVQHEFDIYGHIDEAWSILKFARFHGAKKETCKILEKALKEQDSNAWKIKKHNIPPAYQHNFYCDYCLIFIKGRRFACQACHQIDFCYKCYGRKEELHPGHQWSEIGPEFVQTGDEFENGEEDDEDSAIGKRDSDSEDDSLDSS